MMKRIGDWLRENNREVSWFIIGWMCFATLDALIRGNYAFAALDALLAYLNYKMIR